MEWLKKIVDSALEDMSRTQSMMMPGNIPDAMLDLSIPSSADWRGWKPIDSTITDEDIAGFERKIGHGLPLSYRVFLQYKHFFRLYLPDQAVNFPYLLPTEKLGHLQKLIFHYHEPELIIGRNYIYFADFDDYGLLCFDANVSAPNNEYPILYMDHEDLDDIHPYANNFRALLEADSERGNDFIDHLNAFYSERE